MQYTCARPKEKYSFKTTQSSACSGFTFRYEGDQRCSEGRDMNSVTIYFQKKGLYANGDSFWKEV